MTSRQSLQGRVDSAKKHMYTTSDLVPIDMVDAKTTCAYFYQSFIFPSFKIGLIGGVNYVQKSSNKKSLQKDIGLINDI